MRYRVLPYKQGSKGAKALAGALGGRVLRLQGSSYSWRDGDVLINWGNTEEAFNWGATPLNAAHLIRNASNKLLFFRKMRDAGHDSIIPPFWESPDDIPVDRYPVVCRTVLAGHSGDGIVIANDPTELVPCSLYTRYLKKKDEYRVHCSRDQIIAIQRKARRLSTPDSEVDWKVRNHAGGFIYAREGFDTPDNITAAATIALSVTGLDFGAVDVLWNEHEERAYVLEINTAPGLEGQTINDYASFFQGVAG